MSETIYARVPEKLKDSLVETCTTLDMSQNSYIIQALRNQLMKDAKEVKEVEQFRKAGM